MRCQSPTAAQWTRAPYPRREVLNGLTNDDPVRHDYWRSHVASLLFIWSHVLRRATTATTATGTAKTIHAASRNKKRSEAELSEQRERCENVRERCAPAAKVINLLSSSHQILEYHERAPDQDEKAALKEALGVLQKIIDENDGDGALGAIASTELCNVMLAADGLNSLDKLKNHPDSDIAAKSAILQFIVPRIWSC